MAICNCSKQRCACKIESGKGATVSGNGSEGNPYEVDIDTVSLTADDSGGIDVTVTGSGTTGSPWNVSMVAPGSIVTEDTFTNNDTWTKPPGGSIVQVIAVGGGGGGGRPGAASNPAGGSGGTGGTMSIGWFRLSDLDDEVQVIVGQGGNGGTAGAPAATGGTYSAFGFYLRAGGGTAGQSQGGVAGTGVQTTRGFGGTPPEGGPGGAGAYRNGASIVQAENHMTSPAPTGGGIGQGNTMTNSAGGTITVASPFGPGAGVGGNGNPAHFPGSSGAFPGGGGGGGSCVNYTGPGTPDIGIWNGGNGADGVVVVRVW